MNMTRDKWIAIFVCVLLNVAAFIGSTGLFYAEYRPIRNFDLFGFAGAWMGLIWAFMQRRGSD